MSTAHTAVTCVYDLAWRSGPLIWSEAQRCVEVEHPQLLAWEQGLTCLSLRPHLRTYPEALGFRYGYTKDHNLPSGNVWFSSLLPEGTAHHWWQKLAGGDWLRVLNGLLWVAIHRHFTVLTPVSNSPWKRPCDNWPLLKHLLLVCIQLETKPTVLLQCKHSLLQKKTKHNNNTYYHSNPKA